jgi:hypothetical protein
MLSGIHGLFFKEMRGLDGCGCSTEPTTRPVFVTLGEL